MLRDSGVVDAGRLGLVLILARRRRRPTRQRRPAAGGPHYEAPRLSLPHHEDSRFHYCTNCIVAGDGLCSRRFLPRLEGIGDSVLVVGDEAT